MNRDLTHQMRINYTLNELTEKNVSQNPFILFELWFQEAVKQKLLEPNAMIISSIKNDRPRARVALMKEFDDRGIVFYTNYESDKGSEIKSNKNGALTFFWAELERQVRIEGIFSFIDPKESDTYFKARPRESQIGAWVSNQSEIIKSREVLDKKLEYFTEKFKDVEIIPRPENWGGIRLEPHYFEFWQGRPSRLHDRISYELDGKSWKIARLSP
jgi:pyridoxamine 5'-phosphate oxidase